MANTSDEHLFPTMTPSGEHPCGPPSPNLLDDGKVQIHRINGQMVLHFMCEDCAMPVSHIADRRLGLEAYINSAGYPVIEHDNVDAELKELTGE